MIRYVVLDSGPTGLASQAVNKPEAIRRRTWITRLQLSGAVVVVPEIVRYEIRRELVRVGATTGLRRLDALHPDLTFLPLNRAAMELAAELWAHVRRAGIPTAHPHALDADAILAAQTLTLLAPGDSATIATTNAVHLNRFPGVDARDWRSIA